MATVAKSKQMAQQFESVNSKSVRSHLHSSIMVPKTNTSKVGHKGPLLTLQWWECSSKFSHLLHSAKVVASMLQMRDSSKTAPG